MTSLENWLGGKEPGVKVRHWPQVSPKGVVVFIHGLGEHLQRYESLAAWLGSEQMAAYGMDLRGHGETPGKRGHFSSLQELMDDIDVLLQEVGALYPGIPVFLYGQSMGGNLVLSYTLERKPALAGVIASSPWIQLAFEAPRIQKILARLLRPLLPALTLGNGLNVQHISRSPAVVEAYTNDPLVHDRISVAVGVEMMDAAERLHTFSGAFPVPLLLMHGSGDQITSAPASAAFAGRVQGDITFRAWPGLYHELHFEPEKDEIRAFTLAWLRRFVS